MKHERKVFKHKKKNIYIYKTKKLEITTNNNKKNPLNEIKLLCFQLLWLAKEHKNL